MRYLSPLIIPAVVLLPVFAHAADSPEGIAFFESKIRPVLVEKCYSCHSDEAEKIKGNLRVDFREALLQGGDMGPSVVPSKPEESLLLTAIRYHDKDLEMPPKERLPENVVADFEKWIAMGAPDPRTGDASALGNAEPEIDIEEGRKHWSFQPVADPEAPTPSDPGWARSDVDRFILAGLDKAGLKPVGDATPVELLRRISYDLTGLPPTAAEVRKFSALSGDEAEAALQALIDQRMNSQEFGERWGRHWLDVARFGESTGGTSNLPYPVAFRYRNYVIDAFNEDKPYDEFLREQLAGDLMPAESEAERNEQLTATGFLCVGPRDLGERDNLRYTMAIVEEQIDTVSRGILGLTLACAKCHDHMFDPVPTEDYYALAGIFSSSEPQLGIRRSQLGDPLTTRLQVLEGSPVQFSDEEMVDMLKRSMVLMRIRLDFRDEKRRLLKEAGLLNSKEKEQEAYLEKQPSIIEMEKKLATDGKPYDELVERYRAAIPHSVMAMRDRAKPADCEVHIRGDDKTRGDKVPRGFPAVLTTAETQKINQEQSGRLELAAWIASEDNPLTARVMVNRVWQHLFGVGLVDTPDDFGKTGQKPVNPALLDHLATRFMEEGWSVKSLISYLMSSRVYQLGTDHDNDAWEADPDNRLCWRMSQRRLDANAIRDSLMAISGNLKSGPPEKPYIQLWEQDLRLKSISRDPWFECAEHRRAVYLPMLREYILEDLIVFDFPEPSLVTGRRDLTTVPTQALYLMNSPFAAEHAAAAAERLLKEAEDVPGAFVDLAWQSILGRNPDAAEREEALAFFAEWPTASAGGEKKQNSSFDAASALCQSLIASGEFRYLF